VSRRCPSRRSVSADVDDGEIRISVEVYVRWHPSVHLTTGRVLMILLQELRDDGVPVQLVRVGLSGPLGAEAGGQR
jgi:hypothetical protein